jgi:hypothetical protein
MFGSALMDSDPDTAVINMTQWNKKPVSLLHKMVIFFPAQVRFSYLKVHKIENFFGSDLEFCVISLLVMLKY